MRPVSHLARLAITLNRRCRPSKPRVRLQLHSLEGRLAPATFVNANSVTYQDVDGDTVTVSISKPIFSANNVGGFFRFDTGGFGNNNTPQSLQELTLTDARAQGATVSITAKKPTGEVSNVDVGLINADVDLKAVTVAGDLSSLWAGDENDWTPGLGACSRVADNRKRPRRSTAGRPASARNGVARSHRGGRSDIQTLLLRRARRDGHGRIGQAHRLAKDHQSIARPSCVRATRFVAKSGSDLSHLYAI